MRVVDEVTLKLPTPVVLNQGDTLTVTATLAWCGGEDLETEGMEILRRRYGIEWHE